MKKFIYALLISVPMTNINCAGYVSDSDSDTEVAKIITSLGKQKKQDLILEFYLDILNGRKAVSAVGENFPLFVAIQVNLKAERKITEQDFLATVSGKTDPTTEEARKAAIIKNLPAIKHACKCVAETKIEYPLYSAK